MDFPSNPNFCENHGNRNTRVPEQNFHVNDLTLTPAEIESMRQQPVYSGPILHGGNAGSNDSINLISSEQDLPGTNQTSTAAEKEQMVRRQQQSGQRQPADIFSADSSEQNHHPVNNQCTVADTEQMRTQQRSGQHQLPVPDISTADSPAVLLNRKRKAKGEADRRYRAKTKIKQAGMELKVTAMEAEIKSLKEQFEAQTKSLKEQFEAETKSLKEQLDAANLRCGTKQRKLDKLREDFAKLEKKYRKQHESKQALEAENRRLKADNGRLRDKYIELLEKSNPLVDPRFGTQSKEPGRQHGQTTNLSLERDFGGSGIDSITQPLSQIHLRVGADSLSN